MIEPWNSSFILQPPVHTTLASKKINVNDLKHTCQNVFRTLSNQSPLHRESALLSRFLYKYDKKFRNDIGYSKFKKVNTVLRKYLTLNLLKDVSNFQDMLPPNDENYLPTSQMLEYVLVRIMTFSKLMLRINICSKQAAIFYLNRIKNGESHWMSLMPYSLLCRIWSLALVLLQHSCNWYNRLHPFLNDLEHKGLDFLPKGYELPKNLDDWIDLKNVNDEGRFNWAEKQTTSIDASLIGDKNDDLCENILQYVDNINVHVTSTDEEMKLITSKPEIIVESNIYRGDDTGEAVSRDNFKCLLNEPSPTITNDENLSHSFDYVKNKDTLNKFLNNEEAYRNKSSELAITNHLSFMQWQVLKNSLLKLDNVITPTKVQKKAQKVWKEKCLDYM